MRTPSAATLRGIEAACEVALAAFEAAPDGSGDGDVVHVTVAVPGRIDSVSTAVTVGGVKP